MLVAEVGVDLHLFRRGDLIKRGELGGGRADVVHQAGMHLQLRLDARCQMYQINVAQLGEDLLLTGVGGVKVAEIILDIRIFFLDQCRIKAAHNKHIAKGKKNVYKCKKNEYTQSKGRKI